MKKTNSFGVWRVSEADLREGHKNKVVPKELYGLNQQQNTKINCGFFKLNFVYIPQFVSLHFPTHELVPLFIDMRKSNIIPATLLTIRCEFFQLQ